MPTVLVCGVFYIFLADVVQFNIFDMGTIGLRSRSLNAFQMFLNTPQHKASGLIVKVGYKEADIN